MRLTREEAAANALEGQPRCSRCDKPHSQAQPARQPRCHLTGIVGRTAFGYLGMPDLCGRTWTVEWRRVPHKDVIAQDQAAPMTAGTRQLEDCYGPAQRHSLEVKGSWYVTALPLGSVFVMEGHTWVAMRARSFWSRNKAREWARRWLTARINTRGTKHRRLFDTDLEVPDAEQGAPEGDRGPEEVPRE